MTTLNLSAKRLEDQVPDNEEWNVVAIYALVEVVRFKKTVTRTAFVQKEGE